MRAAFARFSTQVESTPRGVEADGQIMGLRLRPGGQWRHGLGHGAEIGEDAILAHALVVEWRQHEGAGEAQIRCMARQGDGGAKRRRAHQRQTVAQRERGRLAGGAKHIQRVAAIVEQMLAEFQEARGVGLVVRADRRGDGGDYAAQGGCYQEPQRLVNWGARFSTKAAMPSFWSWVAKVA